jgi:hypothetical protein
MGMFDMGDGDAYDMGGMSELRGRGNPEDIVREELQRAKAQQSQQQREHRGAEKLAKMALRRIPQAQAALKIAELEKKLKWLRFVKYFRCVGCVGCGPVLIIFLVVALISVAYGIVTDNPIVSTIINWVSSEFDELTSAIELE